jgi:hypothetical protein
VPQTLDVDEAAGEYARWAVNDKSVLQAWMHQGVMLVGN